MSPDMTGVYIVHFASRAAVLDLAECFCTLRKGKAYYPAWLDSMLAFAFTADELRLLRQRFTSRG